MLFRPEENFKRLLRTTIALGLPEFDVQELLKCLMKLCIIDRDWIPKEKGFSMYIRPVIFETSARLNFAPVTKAKLVIGCCPVGPIFKTGFNAVRILADAKFIRCC